MKKTNKKLQLNTESVRALSVEDLDKVAGGVRPISFADWTCPSVTLPGCAHTRFIFTCEISACLVGP